MIKEAIAKIVSKEDLTYDEAYSVINEIMSGETTPTQNAAFLAALSTKSTRAETIEEIYGCAAAVARPDRNFGFMVKKAYNVFVGSRTHIVGIFCSGFFDYTRA